MRIHCMYTLLTMCFSNSVSSHTISLVGVDDFSHKLRCCNLHRHRADIQILISTVLKISTVDASAKRQNVPSQESEPNNVSSGGLSKKEKKKPAWQHRQTTRQKKWAWNQTCGRLTLKRTSPSPGTQSPTKGRCHLARSWPTWAADQKRGTVGVSLSVLSCPRLGALC